MVLKIVRMIQKIKKWILGRRKRKKQAEIQIKLVVKTEVRLGLYLK
jgi:hypothetical protein